MHHLRSADIIFVRCITICLQDAIELAKEPFWHFAFAAHAEVEDVRTAGGSILPQKRFMVLAALVVHLHAHRRLVSLDVTAAEQLAAHDAHDGLQHLTHSHDPSIHGGAADVEARIALEDHALPIDRKAVGIM